MISEPQHGRRLVVGAVSLTKQRHPRELDRALEEVQNEIEMELISKSIVPNEKFTWISLVFRLGLVDQSKPSRPGRVSKYGDLSLSIEVDCSDYLELPFDELRERLLRAGERAIENI